MMGWMHNGALLEMIVYLITDDKLIEDTIRTTTIHQCLCSNSMKRKYDVYRTVFRSIHDTLINIHVGIVQCICFILEHYCAVCFRNIFAVPIE